MAGRAGQRALAGALDVDAVLVSDLENREAQRRLDLAAVAVVRRKSFSASRIQAGSRNLRAGR
jgi:hypothetical protein